MPGERTDRGRKEDGTGTEWGRKGRGPSPFRPGSVPSPSTSLVGRLIRALRRIAGMPDYDRYVEHLRACHPDRPIPDRAEFFRDFVEQRYRGGGGRCC